MDAHDRDLVLVATQVRDFYKRKQPYRIYHGSTNTTQPSKRRRNNVVNVSFLNHVLEIDVNKQTALVEPNVPMDKLVSASLQYGLVPLVVMEFPGITVGGGFAGTSGESSSFRYGAFDATVNWIEIIIPNGEILRASRVEDLRTDLFWGAASSFGTLGVVTLLEIQLKKAAPYVQLTYTLQDEPSAYLAQIKQEMHKDSPDYLDAVSFSKDRTIVCSGRLTDQLPNGVKPTRFTRSWDPWFYVHLRRLLKRQRLKPGLEITDWVPLADYLFRYDRGAFWVAVYSFRYFITPFNRITRFILNPFMHTRTMYRALHKSGLANYYLIQDVSVPFDRVPEFAAWLDETFTVYPIWICPLNFGRKTPNAQHGLHSDFGAVEPGKETGAMMNFGVWGPGSFDRKESVHLNRLLELKVQELGGKKWLYAHAYYTEEEFWQNYDRNSYDAVRKKYKADWLPNVYDKVKVDWEAEERELQTWTGWLIAMFWSIWPLRGLYGVLMTILGGDYLLKSSHYPSVKPMKKTQ